MKNISKRWEKDSRYYLANLHQDILNDWVILKAWGRKSTKLGHYKIESVKSLSEGLATIKQIEQLRQKRGYNPV